MAAPVLVTPPADPVVSLSDLKDHLRVDADDENDLIEALEQAAVAHLDGWHGILGRAIMAQVWSQSFATSGMTPCTAKRTRSFWRLPNNIP